MSSKGIDRRQFNTFGRDKPKHEERTEQIAFANDMRLYFPKVLWTISVAGAKIPKIVWILLLKMGYSSGTPDIWILEPKGKYHGLIIELKKVKGGRISEEQIGWLEELNLRGYRACRCNGAGEALTVVTEYMSLR